MEGRKGFKLIIEIVVGMIFILMVFFFLGVCSGGEIIDVGLFVMMFVFFLFFGVFVFFFIGCYFEKYGYWREDFKWFYVIFEENWGRDRFVKDV